MQANAHQTARAHCDGAPVHYARHRPEQTTLYRLVQQHAATFFAQAEETTGADLPQFVKDEFDAFLECGILAHGFLRLRCGDCGHDKLLAFSCKRRGFCPSCGARRMSQTAAHLVDHVIPHVPVRQWVLSLPIPLRVLLAAQPKLVTPVLQVVHRVITRHLLGQAGLTADQADSGAVTLIQRFGSAANLNIHLHCLVLDGVYRCGADGVPVFVQAGAPSDDELHALLHAVITRLMKMLTRHGVLIEEVGQTYLADSNADGDEARTLRPLQAAAITYRIAFGPRAGQKVLTLRGAMAREGMARELVCSDIDGNSEARGRADRSTRPQAAGAAVPIHHPSAKGSLPNKQLKKTSSAWPSCACSSLPNRQLRNDVVLLGCSFRCLTIAGAWIGSPETNSFDPAGGLLLSHAGGARVRGHAHRVHSLNAKRGKHFLAMLSYQRGSTILDRSLGKARRVPDDWQGARNWVRQVDYELAMQHLRIGKHAINGVDGADRHCCCPKPIDALLHRQRANGRRHR